MDADMFKSKESKDLKFNNKTPTCTEMKQMQLELTDLNSTFDLGENKS